MARKSKKATVEADAQPKLTEAEALDKHIPMIKGAASILDDAVQEASEARCVYRAALKAAKSDGLDIDTLAFVLKKQKQALPEVERFARSFNSYMKFLGVPLGTQLGLDLTSGKSIATALEDEQIADAKEGNGHDVPKPTIGAHPDADEVSAYHEGEEASRAGRNLDTCPHKGSSPKAKRLREQFMTGWHDHQAEQIRRLGPTATSPARIDAAAPA